MQAQDQTIGPDSEGLWTQLMQIPEFRKLYNSFESEKRKEYRDWLRVEFQLKKEHSERKRQEFYNALNGMDASLFPSAGHKFISLQNQIYKLKKEVAVLQETRRLALIQVAVSVFSAIAILVWVCVSFQSG